MLAVKNLIKKIKKEVKVNVIDGDGGIVCLLILLVVWALPAWSLSAEPKTGPEAAEAAEQESSSALGGPCSVAGQLDEDRKAQGAVSVSPDLVAIFGNCFDCFCTICL